MSRKVGREESVKRLKAFTKFRIGQADEVLGDVVMAETDRGAVILLTTAIEDILARRLRKEMVDLSADEDARMFGPDAPLGSFSARIRLAYALGLIDRPVARMCDLLREMRNACAHSGRAVSFKNKELRDVFAAIWSYISDELFDLTGEETDQLLAKLYFAWIVGWLAHTIRTGDADAASTRLNRQIAEATQRAKEAGASVKAKPLRSTSKRKSSGSE